MLLPLPGRSLSRPMLDTLSRWPYRWSVETLMRGCRLDDGSRTAAECTLLLDEIEQRRALLKLA